MLREQHQRATVVPGGGRATASTGHRCCLQQPAPRPTLSRWHGARPDALSLRKEAVVPAALRGGQISRIAPGVPRLWTKTRRPAASRANDAVTAGGTALAAEQALA